MVVFTIQNVNTQQPICQRCVLDRVTKMESTRRPLSSRLQKCPRLRGRGQSNFRLAYPLPSIYARTFSRALFKMVLTRCLDTPSTSPISTALNLVLPNKPW